MTPGDRIHKMTIGDLFNRMQVRHVGCHQNQMSILNRNFNSIQTRFRTQGYNGSLIVDQNPMSIVTASIFHHRFFHFKMVDFDTGERFHWIDDQLFNSTSGFQVGPSSNQKSTDQKNEQARSDCRIQIGWFHTWKTEMRGFKNTHNNIIFKKSSIWFNCASVWNKQFERRRTVNNQQSLVDSRSEDDKKKLTFNMREESLHW